MISSGPWRPWICRAKALHCASDRIAAATAIGFREDIDAALHTLRFLFKFVVILPLAIVTVGELFRSTGPVLALGWWARLLPLPLLLLWAGVAAELLAIPRSDWMVRAVGSNAVNGMTLIPLLAGGPLTMFIAAFRSGAIRQQHRGGVLRHELFRRQSAVRMVTAIATPKRSNASLDWQVRSAFGRRSPRADGVHAESGGMTTILRMTGFWRKAEIDRMSTSVKGHQRS